MSWSINILLTHVFLNYLLKHHCRNCSGRHYPCISSSFCVFFSPRPLSSFYLVQLEVSQTYKNVSIAGWKKNFFTSYLTLNRCRQHLWVGQKQTQEATSAAAGPASPPASSRAGRSPTLASWRGNSCGTSSSDRPRKIGRCCTGRCSRRPASPWSRPRRSGLWSSPSIVGSWDQRSPWGAIIEKNP